MGELRKELEMSVYKIEDSICSLILCLTDLEKYRRELISRLDYREKNGITSLERAYFNLGPPKLLYILVPTIPPSLNHTLRLKMPKHRYAYSAVFAWWDTKIKNALENLENPRFEQFKGFVPPFSKAIVFVKVTFPPQRTGDLDNYAVKAIVDSLKKNSIIKDDNAQIFHTFLAQSEVGDSEESKMEIFVVEDERVSDFIAKIYKEWLELIPEYVIKPTKAQNTGENNDGAVEFFKGV
ncbi:hypothetical protein AN618_21590 [Fervidicola ferrireducens]|uniref:Uncharacterized protein n=1 Tax=Fervidicola ferrireducens TaxID=520764 RepID=A0A140L2U2_9FIRM|nr:hypothetical protein [Fervidicola ferrireducens]KXG74867.1 hypothetical protein AN618_21590 [Fervidicola ferrireducens]